MRQYLRYSRLLAWLLLSACKAYDAKLLDTPSRASAISAACASSNSVDAGLRIEQCNGVDDDCDGTLDEDVVDCNRDHAHGRCVLGQCTLDRCDVGFGDCDSDYEDGCERSLGTCNRCDGACDPGAAGAPALVAAAGAGSLDDRDAGLGYCPPDEVCTPPVEPTTPTTPAPQPDPTPTTPDPSPTTPDPTPPPPEPTQPPPDECTSGLLPAATCACIDTAPSGQGADCDRCLCTSCSDDLETCTGTPDMTWNTICGALVRCYGNAAQHGQCPDATGACQTQCGDEYTAAFQRYPAFDCNPTPATVPCGALNRLRESCYATKCAAVCKR